jgi:phosphoenolpyruvate-protein kinase (PTS system EI component)
MQKILSEISLGELLDKISILEIKLKKIKNRDKILLVKKEYKSLKKTKNKIKVKKEINNLYKKLKKTNQKLWNIEDKIRKHEKQKKFNKKFIILARSVYQQNDLRSKIKLEINKIMNSNIVEVKSYSKYS